jgi:ArsR family transcriptional regulator
MLLVLGYVPDARQVIGEMARVLRPSGRAVVVDVTRHDDEEFRRRTGQQQLGFEEETVEGLLNEAGLGEIRWRELSPESGTKGPALFLASASNAAADRDETKQKEKAK